MTIKEAINWYETKLAVNEMMNLKGPQNDAARLALDALRAQQEQPNEPLTVEELREMWQEHSAVYVTNIDCTPIFGGKVCVAAVLDTVAAFGSCGGMVLQAIYGRSLTLAEGDYGKTWLAYRFRPEQEE